jgi:hypothetical protein
MGAIDNPSYESLTGMKLHEEIIIYREMVTSYVPLMTIIRVVGGWIYRFPDTKDSVFVPDEKY